MALLFGLGIVGGAFLLSWAAEVAQLDISASFAIAILALIAILPEYAIEAVLAWNAGESFDLVTREVTKEMSYVAANVTGANRLLIGLGWSAVILVFWFKRRRRWTCAATCPWRSRCSSSRPWCRSSSSSCRRCT